MALPAPCNLLIIDTETTGLELGTDQVIELAAVLYSVDYQTTLHQMSTLIRSEGNPAEHINHIPSKVLPTIQESLQAQAEQLFRAMINEASFFVAHNADFDKQWFRDEVLINENTQAPLRWLCTMTDFTWPKQTKPGESLVNLALHHGIGVSSAHRALTDCQLIAALLDRLTPKELTDVLLDALKPRHWYRATVSYDDRHLAKQAGFRWDRQQKLWIRKMTPEQAQELPFQVALTECRSA
jgi:DNA polymerase-3 subunit epsilon